MRIDIISAVPSLLQSPLNESIIKRGRDKGKLEIVVHDLRDYAINDKGQIDDYAYGGGAGMVLMIEPVYKCINLLRDQRDYDEVIYMSPDGELLEQSLANKFSLLKNMVILCGHYKGIDQRIRDHLITREISIGNYVLSGGELAAAVLVDAVGRLVPGVLNDETSALSDSFQDGLIAPPVFTRPADYQGWKVPDVLLSGHAARIEEWRHSESLRLTKERRPGLLKD